MTVAALPSNPVIGPTWTRGEDGLFILPALTLGWQVIDWCEEYLLQPDGPDAGQPLRLTKEQKRWFLWWYAVDERGRFLYLKGMLRRLKGWGKDPLAVFLAAVELVGPCRFGGWDAEGQPIAVPQYAACIQIAAVSQAQVKRNTMSLFPGLFSARTLREFDIDVGKEIIYANQGRGRIELLSTSPRSTEGPRPTLVIKNETQHWLERNGGEEMSAVCARNAAKSRDGSTRILAISNAHSPGEGSDAEADFEAYLQNPSSFMYDSIEASLEVVEALNRLRTDSELSDAERAPLKEVLLSGLRQARGDSDWLDLERLLIECLDPRTSINTALRFYFNRLAAGSDRAFNISRWQALAQRKKLVSAGAKVAIGFDGSVTTDHTAAIGTELATGYQWVIGYWEPQLTERGEFEVPKAEVDATIIDAFERWDVCMMYADFTYWWEEGSRWAGRFGPKKVVSFRTERDRPMAVALQSYNQAIELGELRHDGDQRFTACIGNAHKQELAFRDEQGELMWTISKERAGSPLKIDAAMAGCLSWTARNAAIAAGALEEEGPTGMETRGFLTL